MQSNALNVDATRYYILLTAALINSVHTRQSVENNRCNSCHRKSYPACDFHAVLSDFFNALSALEIDYDRTELQGFNFSYVFRTIGAFSIY